MAVSPAFSQCVLDASNASLKRQMLTKETASVSVVRSLPSRFQGQGRGILLDESELFYMSALRTVSVTHEEGLSTGSGV